MRFDHLTVNDGLSANTILCIYQDSRGFLWIGTFNGLNRYDGYTFKVYKNSQDDSTSISNNQIRAMCEDNSGNLWIGTWAGGLNKFNRKKESFKRYTYNQDNEQGISSDGIISLCKDKTGNIWIGTEGGGLNYLDVEKEIFKHYTHHPENPYSISSNSIYVIYEDKNSDIWIGTANRGLNKFLREQNKFIAYKHSKDDPESISGNIISSITEDHFGNFWIGTRNAGINKFDRTTNKFKRFLFDPDNPKGLADLGVWVIYADTEGFLWIGNYSNGLSLFDPRTERFTTFRKNYNDPKSLSDDAIFSIYQDRSGILWAGTWSGGLNKYDKRKEKFSNYSHEPNNINSLSNNSIYSIYKDKSGILWVGTDGGGLNRIDELTNRITRFKTNTKNLFSISSNHIYSICEDEQGFLWIGTDDAGINKLDSKSGKFIRFQNNPDDEKSLSNNAVSQIFFDSFGDLWVGLSGSGIDRLKKNENGFIHYKNDPGNLKSVSSEMVYSFYEDDGHNLWIGTYSGGLMLFNRQADNFDFYFQDKTNPANGPPNNIISSICEDDNGILWIGTNGSGFSRFDRAKKQFKHFTEKNGLISDVVYGILKDDKGNLWISTGLGISRFNIKQETFKNFDSQDGLQGKEFNQWAYFKSAEGRLYFGGVDGLSSFHPDQLTDNPVPPKIVITNFQLLHKPVSIGYDVIHRRTILENSITETSFIELKHSDNILSFETAALDFHNPGKNNYAYRLEGFDEHWIHSDASHRDITYTNIDPGDYTLKIKGSNSDGVWNETGISLKIIIKPPWWSTWWAYTLYGLVIVFLFTASTRIYLYRQRINHQLKLEQEHAKKLEEIDHIKSSFYANISHEFRTPLMLILGPVEKLLSKFIDDDSKKQAGLIKNNANKLLNLINQLLDLSKIEAGKLKLQASPGNIVQFVKGVVMEFESLAEKKDISIRLKVERENVQAYFDHDKLEKIISNLMSNALKFTHERGTIDVSINKVQDYSIEITIRDTGIGIPKSELNKIFNRFYQVDGSHTREHEGTGIGLALTKELVELHKGQIFIDSEEGKWTEIKLYFPLGNAHLDPDEIVELSGDEKINIIPAADLDDKVFTDEETLPEHLIDKTIVLVVEDNADVREYIKESLSSIYHIEEAANGEQGFRKAEKYIPDLIISDVMMPKIDGYEMTKRIRQDEKTSHIPVILLTAKSDQESKIDAFTLGVDEYLIKPFDTNELQVRVKNLIEMRRFLHEKFSKDIHQAHKVEKPKLSAIDENFMNRIMNVVETHLSEEEFSIEEFGKDVGMSRSQMHRKLKAITGKSASVYLRTVRLARAKQMIENKKGTISEISYQVGFSSPAYFSRCFREEFGYAPSDRQK